MQTVRRIVAVVAVGLMLAGGVAASASASTTTTSNPVTVQMTDPSQDGLVVRGTTGTSNPFIVYDRLGQPITAVGESGGLKVFGDNLAVNAGSDIFHSQVTISPNNPDSTVCVRNGQLWVGGPAGDIWRCANLGGGYGWWLVVS